MTLAQIDDRLEKMQNEIGGLRESVGHLSKTWGNGKAPAVQPGVEDSVLVEVCRGLLQGFVKMGQEETPISKQLLVAAMVKAHPEVREQLTAKFNPQWPKVRGDLVQSGWLVQDGAPKRGIFKIGPTALVQ